MHFSRIAFKGGEHYYLKKCSALRFKELQTFIMILVSKMVWRALNNPEADWRLDDDKENGIITNKGMWIINNGERTFVDAWLSRQ